MNQSSNLFENLASEYSDEKIITILNSKDEYLPKLFEACKTEAEKRELSITIQKQVPKEKLILYLADIKRKLSYGEDMDTCKTYLLNNGLSEIQTNRILEKAQTPVPKYTISDRQIEEVNLWTIGTIFSLISLTIRFYFCLSE